jgi:hypothetical protein
MSYFARIFLPPKTHRAESKGHRANSLNAELNLSFRHNFHLFEGPYALCSMLFAVF